MNRPVVLTMNEIFNRLKSFISVDDSELVKEYQRHIKAAGNKELTIDIVKRAILLRHEIEDLAPILGFIYNDSKYIVVLGKYENLFSNLSFDSIAPSDNVELYQGGGMLAIANKVLPLKNGVGSMEIINRCFGFDEGEHDCFDFEEISDLFENYAVFKIDDHVFHLNYVEDFYRLEAIALTSLREYNGSVLQSKLKKFMLLEGSRSLAESIINGLKSNQWEYTYLQFYQCLEYLFAVNNAIELKDKYGMSDISPAIDIASDSILKKTEKDSLIGVLTKYTPPTTLDVFCKATFNSEESNRLEKAAEYIYKIRCNLAHLRFKQDALPLKCDKMVMLEELAGIIADTYENLDDQIVSICETKKSWIQLDN